MIFSRFSALPERFVQDYELILASMGIIGSDIRRGQGISGSCHAVSRTLAKFFPDFQVKDGYIPRLAPKEYSEFHGARAVLDVEGEKELQAVRYKTLIHSWLVWKDTNLIIDPWPVGAGYGFNPPIVRFQDGFDIVYIEHQFQDMFEENKLQTDMEQLSSRLIAIFSELQPENANTQKAA